MRDQNSPAQLHYLNDKESKNKPLSFEKLSFADIKEKADSLESTEEKNPCENEKLPTLIKKQLVGDEEPAEPETPLNF
jgi:hypothetical protein